MHCRYASAERRTVPAWSLGVIFAAVTFDSVWKSLPALPTRGEPVPECIVRLVRKRSGGYRLIEMEDRVGSGNVGGPGWKARPIGIAVGREVHPVLRDDFFETAVGIGPGPVWRHKISKHIGKFGAVISSKILPRFSTYASSGGAGG